MSLSLQSKKGTKEILGASIPFTNLYGSTLVSELGTFGGKCTMERTNLLTIIK